MSDSDLERQLDDPVWSCLTTCHAHFAHGSALARRYVETISPIGAVAGLGPANIAALEALVPIGVDIALIGPSAPALGANWQTQYASSLWQMIRSDRSPLPEPEFATVQLGAEDVREILELVRLTKPGPFRQRTIELGMYIGLREHGRLIAMAGERMWIGAGREVSAVCTHPDAQGRGLARALVGRVVNGMLSRGETPILHVDHLNRRAIDMYLSLGFVRRAALPLLHTKRVG